MTDYGRAFGLLFQATDDLLDVLGEEEKVGKSLGKDAASGKLTYCSLYGTQEAAGICDGFRKEAEAYAARLAPADVALIELIGAVAARDH